MTALAIAPEDDADASPVEEPAPRFVPYTRAAGRALGWPDARLDELESHHDRAVCLNAHVAVIARAPKPAPAGARGCAQWLFMRQLNLECLRVANGVPPHPGEPRSRPFAWEGA